MDKEAKFKVLDPELLSSERPLQESYSEMLGSELKNLQKKLDRLEGKMNKRTSPASGLGKIEKNILNEVKADKKRPKSQRSSKKSSVSLEGSSFDCSKGEKKIKKCEKELKSLENSLTINSSQRSLNAAESYQGNINLDLVKQRQTNGILAKDNRILKKKMRVNKDLLNRIKTLEKELSELKISYKRSETIRAKQGSLINQLKKEVNKLKGKRGKSQETKKKSSKKPNPKM